MFLLSIWITGPTRSGKTTRLVNHFRAWVKEKLFVSISHDQTPKPPQPSASSVLILAANDDNSRNLSEQLSVAVSGSFPVNSKTPLGFIRDEVILFWPLLFEMLNLKAQFPIWLRPETELELATRLWRPYLEQSYLKGAAVSESRFVEKTLDLLHLAGAATIAAEQIPAILEQGLEESVIRHQWPGVIRPEQLSDLYSRSSNGEDNEAKRLGKLILEWVQWTLERGLISYGTVYELYWRYLLPNPKYQYHLTRRYQAIFADDVDDYPAITRELFQFLLNKGAFGVFTYNPDGQVRLGLGADPNYLAGLASGCEIEELSSLGELADLSATLVQMVTETFYITSFPHAIQSIQTTSRAQMLRKTAEVIIDLVKGGKAKPSEIAIIAPGLDEIGRYVLKEILTAGGVPVELLNEQRPLIASPLIRALLTLLGLVYQGLGRLVLRDDIAEMLVILSRKPQEGETPTDRKLMPHIDPVRAGLIADFCYHIDPEKPYLLTVETFPRWDRLGLKATSAYNMIREWIENTKILLQQQRTPPISVLDQAIKKFVGNGSYLPYNQLSELRELMETAQHFWEIERRVRQYEPVAEFPSNAIAQFIQLLRRGTITANPSPLRYFGNKPEAVSIANIFQYRSLRSFHPWQFWLDAGSNLWEKGGAATLFAAPLFLQEWSGRQISSEDDLDINQARLVRILKDLLGRVGEGIFLCHSDLGVTGTEQTGPLLPLVHSSKQIVLDTEQNKLSEINA
ncbi:hypothetical protein [Gloeothece verrucosa]|uniref:Recombinase family protein n=1 Tax=Gloeothece verrucosa (strain PCC 7822) TaxID=497965 RepID=E0UEQ0_GLOV7|nr:hypothetical protein [Gloeothece verrucosa]ADN16618.1 conserved hypothetical protein [Gloeothece verrucosa PCC 7822]